MTKLTQKYKSDENAFLEFELNLLSLNVRKDGDSVYSHGMMLYEVVLRNEATTLSRTTGTMKDIDVQAIEAQFRAMSINKPRKTEMSYSPMVPVFGIHFFIDRLYQDHLYAVFNIDNGCVVDAKYDGSAIGIQMHIEKSECKRFETELKINRENLTSGTEFTSSEEVKIS